MVWFGDLIMTTQKKMPINPVINVALILFLKLGRMIENIIKNNQ